MARRFVLILVVLVVLVVLGVAAAAAAVAPTGAVVADQTTTREITLTATPHARTYAMPGRARNITIVAAHENGHRFPFATVTDGVAATLHGGGVTLRFTQHGTRHYAQAVTLSGDARIVVVYRDNG